MPTTNEPRSKVQQIQTLCVELLELLGEAHEREQEQHETLQELSTRYGLIATYAVRLHNALAVAVSISDTDAVTGSAWIDAVRVAGLKLSGMRQVTSVDDLLMWCS